MGIVDPTAMLAVIRAHRAPDNPQRFLDGAFERKPDFVPEQSRFSDGTVPVYYSALERDTTRAEMKHHSRLRLLGMGRLPGASVFLREVRCQFTGRAKDLRREVGAIPHLIGEKADGAYDTCNAIAAEVRAAGLDALMTQSARSEVGTCLPVFTKHSLSNPELGAWVAFSFDGAHGTVLVNEVA